MSWLFSWGFARTPVITPMPFRLLKL